MPPQDLTTKTIGYAIHEMEFYSLWSEHSTHFISYRCRNVEACCLSLQQSGREKQENLVCQAGVKRNRDGQFKKKIANILIETTLFLSKTLHYKAAFCSSVTIHCM